MILISAIAASALFWIGIFTLFSGMMCWICEQKFQATVLPEEEMLWSRFRNWWFLCEMAGAIILVWLLLSSFISSLF